MKMLDNELKSTIIALLKQPVFIKEGNAYIFDRYRVRRSSQTLCHFEFLLKSGWLEPSYETQWLDISILPKSKCTDEYFKSLAETTLAYAIAFALIKHKKMTSQGKIIPLNRTKVVEIISLLNGCLDDLAYQAAININWAIRLYITEGQLEIIGSANIFTGYKKLLSSNNRKLLATLIDKTAPNQNILQLISGLMKSDPYYPLLPTLIDNFAISSEMDTFLDVVLINIENMLIHSQSVKDGAIDETMRKVIVQTAIELYNAILTAPPEADQRKLYFLRKCLLHAMNKEIGCLALILAKHVLESKSCDFEPLAAILNTLHKEGHVLNKRHFFILEYLAKNSSPIIGKNNSKKLDFFFQFAEKYKYNPTDIECLILLVFPRFSRPGLINEKLRIIERKNVFFDEFFSLKERTGLPNIVDKIGVNSIRDFCAEFLMQWAANFTDISQNCFKVNDLTFRDVSNDLIGLTWIETINENLLPEHLSQFDTSLKIANVSGLFGLQSLNYKPVQSGISAIFLKIENDQVKHFFYIDSKVDMDVSGKLQVNAINDYSFANEDISEKLCAYLDEIGYFNRLLEVPIIS